MSRVYAFPQRLVTCNFDILTSLIVVISFKLLESTAYINGSLKYRVIGVVGVYQTRRMHV